VEVAFADREKQNPDEETAIPDEEKPNARAEMAFPDREKQNPRDSWSCRTLVRFKAGANLETLTRRASRRGVKLLFL